MGRYASDTTVPVERTQAEIEACLVRYKATEFSTGWRPNEAMIAFRLGDLVIRFILPIPSRGEKRFLWRVVRGHTVRATERQAETAYEQEVRQRWRALLLVVKAKLEAVECGISTLEQEFLAFIVLPNQQTFGEWVMDNALTQIRAGKMPLMLTGPAEEDMIDVEPEQTERARP